MASRGLIPNEKAARKVSRRPLPRKKRKAILDRDNWICHYCGDKLVPGLEQVDHVVPVDFGGSDDPSNLVASCKYCNRAKHDLLIGVQLTPEEVRKDLFRLYQEPDNRIVNRRFQALVNKKAIISGSSRNSMEAAIKRLAGIHDVRCRSQELKDREKSRAKERRLKQFVGDILSGRRNFGSEEGDDEPKE